MHGKMFTQWKHVILLHAPAADACMVTHGAGIPEHLR